MISLKCLFLSGVPALIWPGGFAEPWGNLIGLITPHLHLTSAELIQEVQREQEGMRSWEVRNGRASYPPHCEWTPSPRRSGVCSRLPRLWLWDLVPPRPPLCPGNKWEASPCPGEMTDVHVGGGWVRRMTDTARGMQGSRGQHGPRWSSGRQRSVDVYIAFNFLTTRCH